MTEKAETNGDAQERVEEAAEELTEAIEEAAEEIAEEVDDAADEVEEVIEESTEEVEEAIEEAAEEIAAATGIDEATARALIREELDARFGPAEPPPPTVTETTHTTVVEPTETDESFSDEPDIAPVSGGSIAARFLRPRR